MLNLEKLKSMQSVGGSELSIGLLLFSLVVGRMAERVLEIGRHKGFSTYCIAEGFRCLQDMPRIGWNCQRPEIDYDYLFSAKDRILDSVDISEEHIEDCKSLLAEEGLSEYVTLHTIDSKEFVPGSEWYDIIFIDGDHTFEGCKEDVKSFYPFLKGGGYLVLHDYFGFYTNMTWNPGGIFGGEFTHGEDSINSSPIKSVCEWIEETYPVQVLLFDTNFMSCKIYRKEE